MALSDQLMDLAARTKKLEDAEAANRKKTKEQIQQDQDKLNTKLEGQADKIQASFDKGQADAKAWWTDQTKTFEQRRGELRTKIAQHKAERKVEHAQNYADDMEAIATDYVAWAVYAVDCAEYAVNDAAIARKEADNLVTAGH